jgi:hypothetical protein
MQFFPAEDTAVLGLAMTLVRLTIPRLPWQFLDVKLEGVGPVFFGLLGTR